MNGCEVTLLLPKRNFIATMPKTASLNMEIDILAKCGLFRKKSTDLFASSIIVSSIKQDIASRTAALAPICSLSALR